MEKRNWVVKESLKLFKTYGIKSVPIARLVHELKVSRKLLYQLFADKNELLAACLELHYAEEKAIGEEVLAIAPNPVEAILQTGALVVAREFQVNPSFYHDVLHYYPQLRQQSIAKNEHFNRTQLTKMLKEGQLLGYFQPDVQPEVAAETMILLFELVAKGEAFSNYHSNKEYLANQVVLPFFKGIATEQGLMIIEAYLTTNAFLQEAPV